MSRVLCALFAFSVGSLAKTTFGSVNLPETNFAFIDKFCTGHDDGTLSVLLTTKNPNTRLHLYHDFEDDSGFPAIYKSGRSCDYLTSLAVQNLTTEVPARSFVFKNSARPRWWFLVASNCVDDEIVLDNFIANWANGGSHMSYEQGGISTALIVSILMLIILIGASVYTYKQKKSASDPMFRFMQVMIFVAGLEMVALIFQAIHRGDLEKAVEKITPGMTGDPFTSAGVIEYEGYQVGIPALDTLSQVIELFPDVIMCSLLLLVGKGWLVNRIHIPRSDILLVSRISVLYLACEIGLLVWEHGDHDPALTLFKYEGVAGTLLCLVRLWVMLIFVRFTYDSISFASENAFFLKKILTLGVVYMLILPISVLVAHNAPAWNKSRDVVITNTVLTTVAYWVFFGLIAFSPKVEVDASHKNIRPNEEDQFDQGPIDMDEITLPQFAEEEPNATNINVKDDHADDDWE